EQIGQLIPHHARRVEVLEVSCHRFSREHFVQMSICGFITTRDSYVRMVPLVPATAMGKINESTARRVLPAAMALFLFENHLTQFNTLGANKRFVQALDKRTNIAIALAAKSTAQALPLDCLCSSFLVAAWVQDQANNLAFPCVLTAV